MPAVLIEDQNDADYNIKLLLPSTDAQGVVVFAGKDRADKVDVGSTGLVSVSRNNDGQHVMITPRFDEEPVNSSELVTIKTKAGWTHTIKVINLGKTPNLDDISPKIVFRDKTTDYPVIKVLVASINTGVKGLPDYSNCFLPAKIKINAVAKHRSIREADGEKGTDYDDNFLASYATAFPDDLKNYDCIQFRFAGRIDPDPETLGFSLDPPGKAHYIRRFSIIKSDASPRTLLHEMGHSLLAEGDTAHVADVSDLMCQTIVPRNVLWRLMRKISVRCCPTSRPIMLRLRPRKSKLNLVHGCRKLPHFLFV
jgi:hypothetical protein